jgi:hypothetical protein
MPTYQQHWVVTSPEQGQRTEAATVSLVVS